LGRRAYGKSGLDQIADADPAVARVLSRVRARR